MNQFKNHELCEAILTWADDYPNNDVKEVAKIYEKVCKNKSIFPSQRDLLESFIKKYKINVLLYIA